MLWVGRLTFRCSSFWAAFGTSVWISLRLSLQVLKWILLQECLAPWRFLKLIVKHYLKYMLKTQMNDITDFASCVSIVYLCLCFFLLVGLLVCLLVGELVCWFVCLFVYVCLFSFIPCFLSFIVPSLFIFCVLFSFSLCLSLPLPYLSKSGGEINSNIPGPSKGCQMVAKGCQFNIP